MGAGLKIEYCRLMLRGNHIYVGGYHTIKDERPTSNVQHRTSNEKTNINFETLGPFPSFPS